MGNLVFSLMPSSVQYERYNEWQTEIHVALNAHMWRNAPIFTDEIDRACYLSERYSRQFEMAREGFDVTAPMRDANAA